jgi:hypothetical protein
MTAGISVSYYAPATSLCSKLQRESSGLVLPQKWKRDTDMKLLEQNTAGWKLSGDIDLRLGANLKQPPKSLSATSPADIAGRRLPV